MTKLTGILDIHGEQGVGKTLMALGIAPVQEIAYLFDDVKRPPISDSDIKRLGYFKDLVQLWKGKKLLEIRDVILAEIDRVPKSCKVIIFDTWGKRVGPSLQYWGKLHYKDFREPGTLSVGDYLYGQMWGEAYLYETSVLSNISNRFESVVLISHLKDHYEAGAATTKKEPMIGKDIPRIANFRIWLKRNPNSGVPIGLVHKPISVNSFSQTGELETVNLLPRRLCSNETEKSIWDIIERYRQTPLGNRKPLPEEEPTEFEASILDGILTTEQREIWRANLIQNQMVKEREEQELKMLVSQEEQAITDFIHSLNGSPLPIIKSKLEAQAKTEGWQQQEFSLGWIAGIIAS